MKLNRRLSHFALMGMALGLLVGSCQSLPQSPRVSTAPTANLQPASNITSSTASLRGTVNPRGTRSWAYFTYGLASPTEDSTAPAYVGDDDQDTVVVAEIGQLQPNATYQVQLVVSNAVTVTRTSGIQFSTQPLAQNRAPVLDSIGPKQVLEESHLEFRVTATDEDGSTPVLSVDDIPANASFVDSLNGSGLFVFDPEITQVGVHEVTFVASDGSLTDEETVQITVLEMNHPPRFDRIGAKSTSEGDHLEFGVTATDQDGTTPTLTAAALPANAAFQDDGNGTGIFVFDPDYDQAGLYLVVFEASDGFLSDFDTAQITVNETNRAPVLDSIGPKSVPEGSHLGFKVSSSDPDGTTPSLSASDVPLHGAFQDSLNGAGAFVFDPDYSQSGVFVITIVSSDGVLADTEKVQVSVLESNVAPVLGPIGPKTVSEGDHLSVHVTSTDQDGTTPALSAEGVPPNASFIDSLNGAGAFEFSPDFVQAGIIEVTFTASDGLLSDQETVQVTVVDINRPPVLDPIGPQSVAEGSFLSFVIKATDPDGSTPVLGVEQKPWNAALRDSVDPSGHALIFGWIPDYDQAGVYNVILTASDGIVTDRDTIQITVGETNREPSLGPIGAQKTSQGQTLIINVSATDPDGQLPALSMEPPNPWFTDNGDGTGTLVMPIDCQQGPGGYFLQFCASDGEFSVCEYVELTVEPAICFEYFAEIAVGTTPVDLIAAPLDGDADIDLAVVNNGESTVSILKNFGDHFVNEPFNTYIAPSQILAFNINANPALDLVILSPGDGILSYHINAGNGTFSACPDGANESLPLIPRAIGISQHWSNQMFALTVTLDRDAGSSWNILDGWHAPPSCYIDVGSPNLSIGSRLSGFVSGDLDFDGFADDMVVIAPYENQIKVLTRESTSWRTLRQAKATGQGPIAITKGKINTDILDDIVVVNGSDHSVSIYYQTGPSTYSDAIVVPLVAAPTDAVIADFDQDGDGDIAVALRGGEDAVEIIENTANGFVGGRTFPVGNDPAAIITTDFDGDLYPDIATCNSNSNSVTVIYRRQP